MWVDYLNLALEPLTVFASMIIICLWVIIMRKVGWHNRGVGYHLIASIFIAFGVGTLMRAYKVTLLDWNMLPVVDRYGNGIDLLTNIMTLIGLGLILFSFNHGSLLGHSDYRMKKGDSDDS